jgi:hypothetical protein
MDYKKIFLEKVTKWVVGGELYKEIKGLVEMYFNNDTMTGAQKREAVITKIKGIAGDVANVFINIALEVAYLIVLESTKK